MRLKPTPKMRAALKGLAKSGDPGDFSDTIGRPTKQRLVKYGLARYVGPDGKVVAPTISRTTPPKTFDWDQDVEITDKGRRVLAGVKSVRVGAHADRRPSWAAKEVARMSDVEVHETLARVDPPTLGAPEGPIRRRVRAERGLGDPPIQTALTLLREIVDAAQYIRRQSVPGCGVDAHAEAILDKAELIRRTIA